MSSLRGHLTYANVVATIALFLALGIGGAYAASKITARDVARNAITSKAIKNNNVASKDVKDLSLRSNDLKADEAFHLVSSTGEPAYADGGEGDCIWADAAAFGVQDIVNPPSFYKDGGGVVRLAGLLLRGPGAGGDGICGGAAGESTEDERAFTLPPGYRPARVTYEQGFGSDFIIIGAARDSNLGGSTNIDAGGVYIGPSSGAPVSLDGVTFRAASGASGLSGARLGASSSRFSAGLDLSGG